MNRHAVLLLAVGIALVAGCTVPMGGQPIEETTVRVEGPTVEPGGNGTIAVVATNAGVMHFDPPGPLDDPEIAVRFERAASSPSPDTRWQGRPPTWAWDRTQRRIVVELPIHVPSETSAGAYRFEVTVSDRTGKDEPAGATANGTVRVVAG